MVDLGYYEQEHNWAVDINNSGCVAVIESQKLVLWPASGTTTTVGAIDAHAINDAGYVAGTVTNSLYGRVAYLYGGSHGASVLGTLGGPWSEGYGLNVDQQVVGYSYVASGSDEKKAFLWQNGTMTNLGSLPGERDSEAVDINNVGQIVGNSDDPFLWDRGVMYNLHDLIAVPVGTNLDSVAAINDGGQIVGAGRFLEDGTTLTLQAYLLVPTPATIRYTLTVSHTGSGLVSPGVGDHIYDSGTALTILAAADPGWAFDNWTGSAADPYAPETQVVLTTDCTVAAVFSVDSDGDGRSDAAEYGPTGLDTSYSGDGDATPDAQQGNVVSGHTYNHTYYVTLAVDDPATLTEVIAQTPPCPGGHAPTLGLPYGSFHFGIEGLTTTATTVVIHLDPAGPVPLSYWKYGPLAAGQPDEWYEFLYDGATQTGAVIDGHEVTLHFVDGERGDDDFLVNARISDDGGPALLTTPPSSFVVW